MMAAGRFLTQHLTPPPPYLGKVNLDVAAYEVLRYVRSAVGEHLPQSRFMVRVNSDVFLRALIERETGWKLKSLHFAEYASRGRDMAEEFLKQLEHLNGVSRPEFVPFSFQPIKLDLQEKLLLTGAILAFQQTIPPAIAEVLEEMIRIMNLNVQRDDRLEAVLRKLN